MGREINLGSFGLPFLVTGCHLWGAASLSRDAPAEVVMVFTGQKPEKIAPVWISTSRYLAAPYSGSCPYLQDRAPIPRIDPANGGRGTRID
jgi:hypothetical protein